MCEVLPSLVDHQLWTPVPLEADPFAPVLPDAGTETADGGLTLDEQIGRCTAPAARYEIFGGEPSYTVLTSSRCHWVTVEQPLLEQVRRGEDLNVRVWYFSQSASGETEARLQLAFGVDVVWAQSVPLPTTSGLAYGTVSAPTDVAVGTPVRWSLSNHGSNSWNLLEFSVTRRVPCPRDAG